MASRAVWGHVRRARPERYQVTRNFCATVRFPASSSRVVFRRPAWTTPTSRRTSSIGGFGAMNKWTQMSVQPSSPSGQQRNYSGNAFAAGAAAVRSLVSYIVSPFAPVKLPASVMRDVGFDPETSGECPSLAITLEAAGPIIEGLGLRKGQIYTGVVDQFRSRHSDSHFYIVAAHCGNVNDIAAQTGIPRDIVESRLSSPLGAIVTWAGSMMAGGAAVNLTPEALQRLNQMALDETEGSPGSIGYGELTSGYDYVDLSNPQRARGSGSSLCTFLARTMYCHALSGSVLHCCYISKTGDIIWLWCGAGGRGINSKYLNNVAAIHMDIGMWPDMARSIQGAYRDPELMRTFIQADPRAISHLTQELVTAGKVQRGSLKNWLQHLQVGGGFFARGYNTLKNGNRFGVKGGNV
jgi:hypothetical protein